MRYSRLRLHSSIFLSLMTLTFFCFLSLHTFIHTTTELEHQEQATILLKSSNDRTFWSALYQPNIYDTKTIQSSKLFARSLLTNSTRIDELFQLVRDAQNNQIHFADQTHSNQFLRQKFRTGSNTNTTDSAVEKTPWNFATTTKALNEREKIQLREFIHYQLMKWKEIHRNDRSQSLANVMRDALVQDEPGRLNTTWFEYIKTVTNYRVYDPYSPELKRLLDDLQNGEISEASEMSQGTQIKLILNLPNGIQGLLKPYRVPRNYQTQPDHFYFSDIERHHAEIAAFHVDKILGFYRVPPIVGRVFNITGDIRDKSTEELAKTFFISPANNTCFRGHCSYYCDTSHAVCGKPGDYLEGSVQILLPRPPEVVWQKITHPYRRSYTSNKKALWESNENYCYESILIDEDYQNRLLLDMMDLAAFDFLIGNLDRHHMLRMSALGLNTGLIHLDNGRSFGRYDEDDLSILAPIRQCCFFRYRTFVRLYQIYQKGLSKLLSKSLKLHEPLQMILIPEHLMAIDRRLEILFLHLDMCMKKYTVQSVMIDDGID